MFSSRTLKVIGRLICTGLILARCPTLAHSDIPKIRVLILTGRNNHDWRKTTPEIVSALTETGRFDVDVEEDVPGMKVEKILAADVILGNFNTFPKLESVWDKGMRDAVEAYLKHGHALVIVHAGSAVFYDWPFFQKLASVTWGLGTHHAKIHESEVTLTNCGSPITAGLKAFQIKDEFWEKAWMTDTNATCLATVVPNPAFGGSGKEEKIMFSNEVMGARGFTILLGHNAEAMENAAWRMLLRRGTEWAATGKVSDEKP